MNANTQNPRTESPFLALTLLGISCLTIMVGCVIVPALPLIAPQLGVATAASWLVTVPSLGVVLFGPIAAKLIERIGLYQALILGLATYGLLGIGGAFLYGPWLVFLDRLLLGGATVVVMASGTGLISVFYQGDKRLSMMAKQGMAIEFGGVVMLSAGGLLASLHWQWPFSLYLSAWLLLAMVLLFIPRPTSEQLTDGTTDKTSKPLPSSLKLVYGAALMSFVVFFTVVIMLPFTLHDIGFSEAQTGYFLSLVSFVAVLAAGFMPKVSRLLGAFPTLICAFVLYAMGHALFAMADSLILLLPGALLVGCGFGFSVPLVNHMTVELSPPHQRGRFLTYLSMAIFSGQFLSSFMDMLPNNSGLMAAAVIAAISAAVIYLMHRQQQQKQIA